MADEKGLRPPKQSDPNPPADASGTISNTAAGHGTLQREATAEEHPADARIAPIAEQLAPNSAPQAVGAVHTEGEPDKSLQPDMSNVADRLPADSDQHDEARRAQAKAALRPDEV